MRQLLDADLAVGVTGAGGPDPQDGRGPGTVFLAVDGRGTHRVVRLQLPDRDPGTVTVTTAGAALRLLVESLTGSTGEAAAAWPP